MTDERRVVAERRTQALRGPGAGGFTPAQSLSAANPCLNCGTNIQLEYCPECGQRETDSDPTLREFLHELAQELINWDGKVVRTIRLLITKPGFLTEEYLAGKRVRYITPLRLYFACSVMFFFFASVIPMRTVSTTEVAPTSMPARDTAGIGVFAKWAKSDNLALRKLGQNFPRASTHEREFRESLFAFIPKAMFVLVPAFAALVALAFRDRRRRYPQHLAFALHVHAMLFSVLAILLVRRFIPFAPVRTIIGTLGTGALLAYVTLAARRVYGGSYANVASRLILVLGEYSLAFFVTIGIGYIALVVMM